MSWPLRSRRLALAAVVGAGLGAPLQAQQAPNSAGSTAGVGGAVLTASLGPLYESLDLGDGIIQPGLTSRGDVRVTHVDQWSVPFAATIPISARWTFDVAGAYSEGRVTLGNRDTLIGVSRYDLRGMTDVRVRATGHLVGDNVLLTLGSSLPTGGRSLGLEELSALRVLGAPALGFQMPGASVGRSATAGLVLARQFGGWAWAAGASYELRGSYNPVQAFSAGIADPDYDPGDAVHLSLGTEGLVGAHAMTLSLGADFFQSDEVRAGSCDDPAFCGAGTLFGGAKLGPVFSAEWQLRVGTHRFRELTLYAMDRYRTGFSSRVVDVDGTESMQDVDGTSGNYLDAGVRAVRPLGGATDLVVGLNARHQTGLDVDASLATAAALEGGLTVGLSRAIRGLLVQPYARARVGSLDANGTRVSTTGLGAGVGLGARF